MRRIIITSFFCLFATMALHSQQELNDSLLYYERLYFISADSVEKQRILLAKICLYLRQSMHGQGLVKEIRRVDAGYLSLEEKKSFLWNGALLCYLNEDLDYSRHLFSKYADQSEDNSLNCELMQLLLSRGGDTAIVNKQVRELAVRDSLFSNLYCFSEVDAYKRKNRNLYLISSAIIPGSGSMMNGYAGKGLISLALTAGSAYGIVKLVEYGLYINAVLWGTGVGLKFYAGNLNLTHRLFYKREAEQKNKLAENCELKLKKLLEKYPLILKD